MHMQLGPLLRESPSLWNTLEAVKRRQCVCVCSDIRFDCIYWIAVTQQHGNGFRFNAIVCDMLADIAQKSPAPNMDHFALIIKIVVISWQQCNDVAYDMFLV